MKKISCLLISSCLMAFSGYTQTVFPLYNGAVPNSKPGPDEEYSNVDANGILRIGKVRNPTLTMYPAPAGTANGTAVIVFPGGGYRILAASHEGSDVAKRFNEMGVTAFVLKYRLPDDATMENKEIGPIQDAQRAIELVRDSAKAWGLNPKRIGIIGFSAGGHLASTAGTHFDHHYIETKKRTNLRPDFMILAYPVISFADSITHKGSLENLLGKNPTPEKIKEYSNELQITKKTPPTFLIHAEDDNAVKIQNSLLFATTLQKNKVPFNFYFYEQGGHGFGLVNKTSDVKWMDLVQEWMNENGWLEKRK